MTKRYRVNFRQHGNVYFAIVCGATPERAAAVFKAQHPTVEVVSVQLSVNQIIEDHHELTKAIAFQRLGGKWCIYKDGVETDYDTYGDMVDAMRRELEARRA